MCVRVELCVCKQRPLLSLIMPWLLPACHCLDAAPTESNSNVQWHAACVSVWLYVRTCVCMRVWCAVRHHVLWKITVSSPGSSISYTCVQMQTHAWRRTLNIPLVVSILKSDGKHTLTNILPPFSPVLKSLFTQITTFFKVLLNHADTFCFIWPRS